MYYLKLTLLFAALAGAAVRVEFPEENPGPPFDARIDPIGVIQDGTWAAIVFYRSPNCVPATFNLLDFFDAPRAFDCPLTVRGFLIWKNGPPPVDSAPIQSHITGAGAVPIWFVQWSELQSALMDNVITVPELWAMKSLRVGSASFFHESLRPIGGGKRSSLQIVAQGMLQDGKSFQVEATATESQPDVFSHVRIAFR
jgi:hypothetical protein